jgi:hypothetical protein
LEAQDRADKVYTSRLLNGDSLMGWVYANRIKRAADFLLSDVLPGCIEVRYSRFYDGTDEVHEKLIADMGYPKDGEDDVPECPEILIDLAASELARQGFVKLTLLDEELADGEPNYLIGLTEPGIAKMMNGEEPVFRDMDL